MREIRRFSGEIREKWVLMSGAAARTGSLKEINNNKNMDSMRKRAGGFQKERTKQRLKTRILII